jgi:hypothetical protein
MVPRLVHAPAPGVSLYAQDYQSQQKPAAVFSARRRYRWTANWLSRATLCLFKIADCHLSLVEPWHAIGYLEACLPLLRDLGLTRHETLAKRQLDTCQAELAGAC